MKSFKNLASSIAAKWKSKKVSPVETEKEESSFVISVSTTEDNASNIYNSPVTPNKPRVKSANIQEHHLSPTSPGRKRRPGSVNISAITNFKNPNLKYSEEQLQEIAVIRQKERLRIIFDLFDGDRDGYLREEEVVRLVNSVFSKEMNPGGLPAKISFNDFLSICLVDDRENESVFKKVGKGATPNNNSSAATRRKQSMQVETFYPPAHSEEILRKRRNSTSSNTSSSNTSETSLNCPYFLEENISENYREDELKEIFFNVFDNNKDGVLTKREFLRVLNNVGMDKIFFGFEIDLLFEMGTNGNTNGYMTFDQFLKLALN
ncbi:hypothetical protein ABK040_006720 [Willaertia magna]